MYDTVVLTQKGRQGREFNLKNLSNWDEERISGQVLKYKKNIGLNLRKGKHNGKLFLGYNKAINSLKVSVALPKLIYGSSLYEIKPGDKEKVTEAIYSTTADYLDFDLDKTKIYRLDNSVNLKMDEPTKKYIYALNNNTDEKIGHQTKGHFEGETLRFISDAETDMFYDKVRQEQSLKGKEFDFEARKFTDKNILRFEIQNKTSEAIATDKRYGKELFYSDLFTDEVIDRTGKLRIDTLTNILRQLKQKYILDYSSITKDLENMRDGNRYALNDFAWYIVQKAKLLSIDEVQRVMRGAGYSRQAIFKHTKKVRKLEGLKTKEKYLIDEIIEKVKVA